MKVMMKKEYITPEILLRRVIVEGIMQQESAPLDDKPGDWWENQEAKDGNDVWPNNSNDVWDD